MADESNKRTQKQDEEIKKLKERNKELEDLLKALMSKVPHTIRYDKGGYWVENRAGHTILTVCLCNRSGKGVKGVVELVGSSGNREFHLVLIHEDSRLDDLGPKLVHQLEVPESGVRTVKIVVDSPGLYEIDLWAKNADIHEKNVAFCGGES